MYINLFEQARRILGRRRLSSNAVWSGQFGFACPQLGVHDYQWGRNRVVNTGLNAILNGYFRSEALPGVNGFFIVPFVANVAPAASTTAANFNSTLTEFTNYDEATRPQWEMDGASTAQELINDTVPALFTVADGVQTTISGAGLITSNAKSATTGVLVAAALAPAQFLNLADGFEVKIKYRLTGASS